MRTFAHEIEVVLAEGSEPEAIGGAVTRELCGHWTHDGPCTWPHLTTVIETAPSSITARVVFGCNDAEEPTVRDRISKAARSEKIVGPNGPSEWRLVRDIAATPTAEEASKYQ